MKYASRGKLVAASVLAGLALGSVGPARAEFAAAVSPPRFELDAEPGKTIRKVIEITHVSPNEGSYRFQTMDWRFSPKGELEFIEDLAPDSCRPWVAIERRTATVAPRGKLRSRFEITPPEGTPAMECRFALMIEDAGEPTRVGPMGIPMTARIGVIVYARVGGVKPELRIEQQLTGQDRRRLGSRPARDQYRLGNRAPVRLPQRPRRHRSAHGSCAGLLADPSRNERADRADALRARRQAG